MPNEIKRSKDLGSGLDYLVAQLESKTAASDSVANRCVITGFVGNLTADAPRPLNPFLDSGNGIDARLPEGETK